MLVSSTHNVVSTSLSAGTVVQTRFGRGRVVANENKNVIAVVLTDWQLSSSPQSVVKCYLSRDQILATLPQHKMTSSFEKLIFVRERLEYGETLVGASEFGQALACLEQAMEVTQSVLDSLPTDGKNRKSRTDPLALQFVESAADCCTQAASCAWELREEEPKQLSKVFKYTTFALGHIKDLKERYKAIDKKARKKEAARKGLPVPNLKNTELIHTVHQVRLLGLLRSTNLLLTAQALMHSSLQQSQQSKGFLSSDEKRRDSALSVVETGLESATNYIRSIATAAGLASQRQPDQAGQHLFRDYARLVGKLECNRECFRRLYRIIHRDLAYTADDLSQEALLRQARHYIPMMEIEISTDPAIALPDLADDEDDDELDEDFLVETSASSVSATSGCDDTSSIAAAAAAEKDRLAVEEEGSFATTTPTSGSSQVGEEEVVAVDPPGDKFVPAGAVVSTVDLSDRDYDYSAPVKIEIELINGSQIVHQLIEI